MWKNRGSDVAWCTARSISDASSPHLFRAAWNGYRRGCSALVGSAPHIGIAYIRSLQLGRRIIQRLKTGALIDNANYSKAGSAYCIHGDAISSDPPSPPVSSVNRTRQGLRELRPNIGGRAGFYAV